MLSRYLSLQLMVLVSSFSVPNCPHKAGQNHDNNVNITHVLEMKRELEIAPPSYTRPAPPGVGGPGGPGTYWVPVRPPHSNASLPFSLCVDLWFSIRCVGFH